jgi:Zn-dependent membrane protease YugP
MFYFDPVYTYVFFITLIISVGVQIFLKVTFNKWSKVPNSSHVNGPETADTIFKETSLKAIPIQPVSGNLTDHYDPTKNVVRLSEPVRKQESVTSMAITAHELGHVQQYQTGSAMIKARSFLLPAVTFSPTVSYICLLMGLIFNMTNLINLGILFFGLMVLFSLLTVPVEFDASRRGLKLMDESGLLNSDEDRQGSRRILFAAGCTYLAAAVSSVLQLLYYISVAKRSD